MESKILNPHQITEDEARQIAADLIKAGEAGVLHHVLEFAAELFQKDEKCPRGLVKVFKRAAEDVDEITQ